MIFSSVRHLLEDFVAIDSGYGRQDREYQARGCNTDQASMTNMQVQKHDARLEAGVQLDSNPCI